MELAVKIPVKNSLLSSFIDDYSIISFDEESTVSPIQFPPLGFPVLLFCVSPNTIFYTHSTLTNESVVVGQLTRYVQINPSVGTKIVGVNFKPYGFFNLFGISLKNTQNSGYPMQSLFGEENVANIYKLIERNDSINDIIIEIENLLLKYQQCTEPNLLFDVLVDSIIKKNGLVRPIDLLPNKKMERSLQRYFSKVIGVGAKEFCAIYRHKFILKYKYEHNSCAWNDVVFEGFYYDYSHFYRDFKKFTNSSPISFPFRNQEVVKILI